MNNSFTIEDVLSGYYEREFSETEILDLPKFSHSYSRKIKRCFDLFEKNSVKMIETPHNGNKISFRRKILFAVIIVILLAFITGAAYFYYIVPGFKGKIYSDKTYIFAVDTENCPQSIKYILCIDEVYEGYQLSEKFVSDCFAYFNYNNDMQKSFVLQQYTKKEYSCYFGYNRSDMEEIKVNDFNGFYYHYDYNGIERTILFWDNGDYIFSISALMDAENALEIAENLKKTDINYEDL